MAAMPRQKKIAHYYGRLKVAPDAPPEVIRAAYKALVQKYHPDRHHGSVRHEIVLAALNKAQEVLLDPAQRAAHDQWIRQEEIRLGVREPDPAGAPSFGLRLRLFRASVQQDGLPVVDALRLHLTLGERVGMGLAIGGLLVLVLLGSAMLLLRDETALHELSAAVHRTAETR